MEQIHVIAHKYNLIVIEDGAHALGAEYQGKRVGTLSDMTTFSFHPVKHITTGEGGMILTDNPELYQRLKLFRTHGITREEELLTKNDGPWYYEQLDLGHNYRITDIQCALGVSQMDRLPEFLEKRKQIAKRYNEAFAANEQIQLPYQKEGCDNAWHLYVIRIKNGKRKEIFEKLRAAGIGVNVHYIPVYQHPYYRTHGYAEVTCPNAEEYYKECISLPMYPDLKEEEQEYVIEKVLEYIR